jgi:hypothetical protein
MLEPRPTEGVWPIDGADERDGGWRVGVDDRELERLIEGTELDDNEVARLIPGIPEDDPGLLIGPTDEFVRFIAWVEPEDELDIIRDREFGVDGLELCVDVILAAAESVGLGAICRVLDGVDGRVFAGVDGRVLTGVEDLVGTGREAGTACFGGTIVLFRLLGVVGLELTDEMLVLRTDVLLLLDIRVDWMEDRLTELLLAGLVGTVECPFCVWDAESCKCNEIVDKQHDYLIRYLFQKKKCPAIIHFY